MKSEVVAIKENVFNETRKGKKRTKTLFNLNSWLMVIEKVGPDQQVEKLNYKEIDEGIYDSYDIKQIKF